MNLATIRSKTNRLLGEYKHAKKTIQEEQERLEKEELALKNSEQAQKIIQEVAQVVQQSAHEKIASVVSRCLSAVFGDEAFEFKIEFVQARGKTEAKLIFERDGIQVDPKFGSGGGVVDVASLALRLSCLRLSQPQKRMTLFLDEPLKWLSAEYRVGIRKMLELLSEELKVQWVIITHMPELENKDSVMID